jgi:hypothetical protein
MHMKDKEDHSQVINLAPQLGDDEPLGHILHDTSYHMSDLDSDDN